MIKITSANNQIDTTSITDLPHLEENEPDDLFDEELDEDLSDKTPEFDPSIEVKQHCPYMQFPMMFNIQQRQR